MVDKYKIARCPKKEKAWPIINESINREGQNPLGLSRDLTFL